MENHKMEGMLAQFASNQMNHLKSLENSSVCVFQSPPSPYFMGSLCG